ncbi:hypothetical protein ACPFUG_001457 [Vibrio cholerae]
MNDAKREALQRIVNHARTKGMIYFAIGFWSMILFIFIIGVGIISGLLWLLGFRWLGFVLIKFMLSGGYWIVVCLMGVATFSIYKANKYHKLTRAFYRSSAADYRVDSR